MRRQGSAHSDPCHARVRESLRVWRGHQPADCGGALDRFIRAPSCSGYHIARIAGRHGSFHDNRERTIEAEDPIEGFLNDQLGRLEVVPNNLTEQCELRTQPAGIQSIAPLAGTVAGRSCGQGGKGLVARREGCSEQPGNEELLGLATIAGSRSIVRETPEPSTPRLNDVAR